MAHFPKQWRKIPKKRLSDLFQNGSVIFHHPYKLFYLIQPTTDDGCPGCNVVISVPKRNIRRAVDRNRIKRQIRESIRLNFRELQQALVAHRMHIELFCLYLPNEHTPTSILSDKMESLLARVSQVVAKIGATASTMAD